MTILVAGHIIRAVRAAIGMSRDEFAELVGLSAVNLKRIEDGDVTPPPRTMRRIETQCMLAGWTISANGISERPPLGFLLEGDNWWSDVLDLAHRALALKKPSEREFLVWFGNDRASPSHVLTKWNEMRADGIRRRVVIEEGNTWLAGGLEEYVWWPQKRWLNNVIGVFGDYVVNTTPLEKSAGTLTQHPALAQSIRNQFEEYWEGAVSRDFRPKVSERHE